MQQYTRVLNRGLVAVIQSNYMRLPEKQLMCSSLEDEECVLLYQVF